MKTKVALLFLFVFILCGFSLSSVRAYEILKSDHFQVFNFPVLSVAPKETPPSSAGTTTSGGSSGETSGGSSSGAGSTASSAPSVSGSSGGGGALIPSVKKTDETASSRLSSGSAETVPSPATDTTGSDDLSGSYSSVGLFDTGPQERRGYSGSAYIEIPSWLIEMYYVIKPLYETTVVALDRTV